MSRSRLLTLLALALAGCTAPESGPEPLVLYLREGRPGPAVQFGRVDINSNDFGSLSRQPPTAGEERSCGSVVAFGSQAGLQRPEQLRVHEVLYRLWWYSGSGRGQLGLNAPGPGGPLAAVPVVDPVIEGTGGRREDGYALVDLRVPVDVTLTGEQLDALYLSLDVGGASVKMATCPVRPALVALNPGEAPSLPGWAEPEAPSCLPPTLALSPEPVEAPASPAPARELETGGSVQDLALEGEHVSHSGDLELRGELSLSGGSLTLRPAADGTPPRVLVRSGATLRLTDAVLAASQARDGFHILAESGSRVELRGATVAQGGFIRLGDDGRVLPTEVALDIRGAAEIRDTEFHGNVVALRLSGPSPVVTGSSFARNGTAIEAQGGGGLVQGNESTADGLFLRLDRGSSGWQVLDNRIAQSLDMALWLDGRAPQHQVSGNTIIDANAGIAVTDRGDYAVIEDNRVRTCRYPIVRHGAEPDPAILERNALEQSEFAGCPGEP